MKSHVFSVIQFHFYFTMFDYNYQSESLTTSVLSTYCSVKGLMLISNLVKQATNSKDTLIGPSARQSRLYPVYFVLSEPRFSHQQYCYGKLWCI